MYELYQLFDQWRQPGQCICDHRTWIYHGLWYCEDAEISLTVILL